MLICPQDVKILERLVAPPTGKPDLAAEPPPLGDGALPARQVEPAVLSQVTGPSESILNLYYLGTLHAVSMERIVNMC